MFAILRERDFSNQKIAKYLSITSGGASNISTGIRLPSINVIVTFARLEKLSSDQLIEMTRPPAYFEVFKENVMDLRISDIELATQLLKYQREDQSNSKSQLKRNVSK